MIEQLLWLLFIGIFSMTVPILLVQPASYVLIYIIESDFMKIIISPYMRWVNYWYDKMDKLMEE